MKLSRLDPNLNTPEMLEYWTALGKFVSMFSKTEHLLRLNIAKLSKLTPSAANALLSGVRIDAGMSYINRLLITTEATEAAQDDYRYVFAQLAQITKVRNDLLHFGTMTVGKPKFLTTNLHTALTDDHIRATLVSASILDEMSADLNQINEIIGVRRIPGFVSAVVDSLARKMRKPWLYKPVQLAPGPTRTPSTPPRRSPPRRPSLG